MSETRPATRTPEALAAAQTEYPDAVRATLMLSHYPQASLVGTRVGHRGVSSLVLRSAIEDVGACHGDPGEYGYRAHLIVSASAQ